MSYYVSRTIQAPFDEVISRTTTALKGQGFGIITDVDIKQTLKQKIGADFRSYRILGACNPEAAHDALKIEDKIGTMLPCNVVVQEVDGGVEVAAIDPVASMQAVENPELIEKARMIRARLEQAVRGI